MTKGTELGNVVKEYTIENTRIKICNDYCWEKTQEDIDRILARIAGRVSEHLSALEALDEEGELIH